jgi:hypothetical protein
MGRGTLLRNTMVRLGTAVALIVGLAGLLGCTSGTAGGQSSGLGPGCLGSPGKACSPYPEATVCPGGPTVCVECRVGVYTPSSSLCSCTSGVWACAPPSVGQTQCPSPVANSDFYVDPSCSVPYSGDAAASDGEAADGGIPAFCVDAGPVGSCTDADIKASNYEQTCQTGSDCILVGEGQSCSPCSLAYGPYGAISRGALPQYEADVAKTPAGNVPVSCLPACTPSPITCCRGGQCHADSLCSGDAG